MTVSQSISASKTMTATTSEPSRWARHCQSYQFGQFLC